MSITIVCPLYNAKKYIDKLHESLMKQLEVDIVEVKYLLTNTGDGLESKLNKLEKVIVEVISQEDFSHSLTREKAAMTSSGDIIVFITQDIEIEDRYWLKKLTQPIYENRCEATFSRQICNNKSIERYTRMKNYGEKSRVVTEKDIETLGIMTFFFSDAASAINASIYKELNGYDGIDLLTNEDMYFSHKLIKNGYRIMYNSEAQVIHSHDYKFNQLIRRYFDQGVFLKQNNYLMNYKANNSALSLLKFVAINSIKEKNLKAFFSIVPNFGARFIGNKLGQNYNKLSKEKILKYSSNKYYWKRNLNK
ncbi:glycosyltransferase family 2 protein [Clostridium perfringens]|uniref:glycosyltransferase family 2 protein n=1 Tax=Clostridium perfringens TaxID=1502 RepID=UPI000D710346|nr:glycosyltransferase [Clostridium perfringens]EGT3602724.1 glycosyltransferase [Clostridium perfringens]EHR9038732.1 glycosyltransferase [Clostridium perfringens]PWX48089.1 rhamnosyltransferase [Clostridium perfringens]HAT4335491.1 glycosyltransferase [Clostridium perfringens]HBJ6023910.1 glycosyltransferase [Clostridium perfringens]